MKTFSTTEMASQFPGGNGNISAFHPGGNGN